MKKNHKIALVFLTVVICWIAIGYILPKDSSGSKENIDLPSSAKTYQLVKLKNISPENRKKEVILIGTTKPSKSTSIVAEVSGKIEEINIQEGTEVEAGDVIITIEKRNREARVQEVKAKVEEKQISYDAAKRLSKSGLQSKSRLAQQKSELEQAKADLIQAEIDLENTKIKAPFSGLLQKVDVEVGEFIQTGFGANTVMALVLDNDPFVITAGVTERLIQSIKLGSEAKVKLVSGEVTQGKVSYISKVANPKTRTFEIEVEVDDEDLDPASGITATVTLSLEERLSYKVPSSSLSLNEQGEFGIKYFVEKELSDAEENQESEVIGEASAILGEGEIFGEAKFKPIEIYDSNIDGIWIEASEEENISGDLKLITVGSSFVEDGDSVRGKY